RNQARRNNSASVLYFRILVMDSHVVLKPLFDKIPEQRSAARFWHGLKVLSSSQALPQGRFICRGSGSRVLRAPHAIPLLPELEVHVPGVSSFSCCHRNWKRTKARLPSPCSAAQLCAKSAGSHLSCRPEGHVSRRDGRLRPSKCGRTEPLRLASKREVRLVQ